MPTRQKFSKHAALLWLGLTIPGAVLPVRAQSSNMKGSPSSTNSVTTLGKSNFSSTCVGCHGLDGRGSERAPSIAGAKVQRYSDTQISAIISNGVPGTGMPGFHSLSAAQVRSIVAYVRALQGKIETLALAGDAKRGQEIFFGKGDCSSCHTFTGQGGFFGPDLSNYGSTASPKAVLDTILSTDRAPQPGYKAAAITTKDGERIEGLIRNEDNFSVQLLTPDGNFHFAQKADLQSIEYQNHSPMPADYGQHLTPGELNDLVNFIISMSAKPNIEGVRGN